jgi:hypothetical protein
MPQKKTSNPASKLAAQKLRTKANKQKARDKHRKNHPNEKTAVENWKKYTL